MAAYVRHSMPAIDGVAYTPASGTLLDLYLPDTRSSALPVVMWSHGSGWLADNGRDGGSLVAAALVPAGFAVVAMSIRSSGQATFPAQLDDIRAALDWVSEHAAEHGLDPTRIATMGESSGGWASAMAALCGNARGEFSAVRAAVCFYPPSDFLRMDEQMLPGSISHFGASLGCQDGHNDPHSPESRLLGWPIQERTDLAKQASPLTHVGPSNPSFLVLHGELDELVPYGQGVVLFEALAAAGGDANLVSLPHAHHGCWDRALAADPDVVKDARLAVARDGVVRAPEPIVPSWSFILEFLTSRLDVRPHF